MRRQKLARADPDLAPGRDLLTAGVEAVDPPGAVAVGDEDLAVRPEGHVARMVERLERTVTLAERGHLPAVHVEGDDLVRVPVDDPDAVLGIAGDHVRVEDPPASKRFDETALRVELHDAVRWLLDVAVAPQENEDVTLR